MPDDIILELGLVHEDLYERFGDDLMRFATGLVGPSDAADVVSDTMLRFWRSRSLVDADNPRALLYRGVLAAARSWQRSMFRRRRRESRTAERLVTFDPEIRPDVVEAVLRLSPRQRACVFLTYWDDLADHQVAELLGISRGTVKRHLHRARQILKEVLDA
jgi:RNA polymerase sigma factor (sigma-70 family)